MPASTLFRWLTRRAHILCYVGGAALLYSVAPFAQGLGAQNPATLTWGIRDFITLLIALLVTVVGAFFTGAKNELERMIQANASQIADLKTAVRELTDENDAVARLLLSKYQTKDDISERLKLLETGVARELQYLREHLDQRLDRL